MCDQNMLEWTLFFETLLPLPEYSFQTTCKGDMNKLSFNKANVQTKKKKEL